MHGDLRVLSTLGGLTAECRRPLHADVHAALTTIADDSTSEKNKNNSSSPGQLHFGLSMSPTPAAYRPTR